MIVLYHKILNKYADALQAARNTELDPLDYKDDEDIITWATPLMKSINKTILNYWVSDAEARKNIKEQIIEKSKLARSVINNKFNPVIADRWGNSYKIIKYKENTEQSLNENFNLVITMKEQEKPILKMIKCINEGKMKTANKYLQEAVEINLKHRIKQAIKTVENK